MCPPISKLITSPYAFGGPNFGMDRIVLVGYKNYATLLLAHDCCFTLLTLSFAVRVSEPVTPIFVPPVEMPAPCHVRLGETTLKPCESFAVCRSRLSLPYVLRSTSLLRQPEKSTQHAKVALDRFKTGRTELRAVAVIALHHFMS
jgi:hypothetical protein